MHIRRTVVSPGLHQHLILPLIITTQLIFSIINFYNSTCVMLFGTCWCPCSNPMPPVTWLSTSWLSGQWNGFSLSAGQQQHSRVCRQGLAMGSFLQGGNADVTVLLVPGGPWIRLMGWWGTLLTAYICEWFNFRRPGAEKHLGIWVQRTWGSSSCPRSLWYWELS